MAAQLCRFSVAGLMFNSRDVQQSNMGSEKEKNQSGDQSQFHMAVVFFSASPPLGNVLRVIQQGGSYTELNPNLVHSSIFPSVSEPNSKWLKRS